MGRLRPIARIQLAKNFVHIGLNCRGAYVQIARDPLIRSADKKKLEDLLLSGR
jgi:hypothetical protein